MIYKLSGQEIIALIAKHASKDNPELAKYDGLESSIGLYAENNNFWCEINITDSSAS